MDWTFLILLVIVVVLIMLSPKYQKSKSYHKNMFHAADVTSLGVVAHIEVFALDDQEFGPLVGLVMNGGGENFRLSIHPPDALFLAQMLETAASAAMAQARPNKA